MKIQKLNQAISIIFLLPAAFLLFFACGDSNSTDNLASNSQISECGGFKDNTVKSRDTENENPNCGDEKLVWSYDPSTKTVVFVNEDVFINCCGDHSINVRKDQETNTYIIEETDSPEGGAGRCSCMCLFDYKVEMNNIEMETLNVKLTLDVTDNDKATKNVWSGSIDLSEKSGSIMIEENVGWCN